MAQNPLALLFEGNGSFFDDRVTIFSSSFSAFNRGFQIEMYAPSILFWFQLLMLVCILILAITLPVAYIMFQLVVAKSENGSSRDDNASKESKSSVTSAIIVFGVIIPSLIAAPYYFVELLELQNVILKGFAVVVPLTTIFHVISTFYRYSPRGVEISLTNYLVYNCMMIPPLIVDQKFIPLVGMKEKLTGLKNVLKSYFVVSLLLSFHESLEYGAVASPTLHIEAEDGLYFLLFKIYDTRLLADNFFFACK